MEALYHGQPLNSVNGDAVSIDYTNPDGTKTNLQAKVTELATGSGYYFDSEAEAEEAFDDLPEGALILTPDAAEGVDAVDVAYDNTSSGLSSSTVQGAIDQINQHLTELERSGAMPILNYAQPLHVFDDTHLTYTTAKDCYLYGGIAAPTGTSIKIDNTEVGIRADSTATNDFRIVPTPLHVAAGSVITIAGAPFVSNWTYLAVYDVV